MNVSKRGLGLTRPLVIGHRGAPTIKMENTLPAFEAAVSIGADMVELDVQRTSDGHLIVFHDYDFSRLASDEREVSSMSLKEIQSIDLGDSVRIPTLEEVFNQIGHRIRINVEIKIPDIESDVLAIVKRFNLTDRILFSSFIHESVSKIKSLDADVKIAILFNQPIEDLVEYARSLDADAVNPLFFLLEPDLVKTLHANNLEVYPWTVNDEEIIAEFVRMNVDGIITDVPDICINVLDQMGC